MIWSRWIWRILRMRFWWRRISSRYRGYYGWIFLMRFWWRRKKRPYPRR
jgi:hypothetical protein